MQHELSKQRNALLLGINTLSLPCSEAQLDSIMRYGELLYQANTKLNLTRVPVERFAEDHILDCLAAAQKLIDNSVSSVIDLGTGAGLPGIPMKIIWPELKVVLVEARGKKVGFLEQVIRDLQLQNIKAVPARAEELAHDPLYRESFDLVCSRALAEMRVFLELAAGFTSLEGRAAALKSDTAQEEANEAQMVADALGFAELRSLPYAAPGSEIPREIFICSKVKGTKSDFPRSMKRIKNSQAV